MKTILIIILYLLLSNSQKAVSEKLTDSYIEIKHALVKSDSETASKKSENMIEIINHIDSECSNEIPLNFLKENRTKLLKFTEQIKNSNKIEIQRKSFEELSILIWDYVKTFEVVNQDYYYFYCPMKKAYWVSYENEVKNPYYGSKMLTCGSISDKRLKK